LTPGERIARKTHCAHEVEAAIDVAVHGKRGSLVAAAEARNVADGNVVCRVPSKSLFKVRFQFGAAAQVATHVSANSHFRLGWGREMKVRIETSYAVDLADRDIDLHGKLLQLICGQVSKLLLNRPELIEQGASVPLRPDHDGKN